MTDRQHGKKISLLSDDCLNLYACSCLAPQHKLLLTQMFAIMKMSQPMGKTISCYNIRKEIPLGNKKRKKSNRFMIAVGEPTTWFNDAFFSVAEKAAYFFHKIVIFDLMLSAHSISSVMDSKMGNWLCKNARPERGSKNVFLTMIYCDQRYGGNLYAKHIRIATCHKNCEALIALGAEILWSSYSSRSRREPKFGQCISPTIVS